MTCNRKRPHSKAEETDRCPREPLLSRVITTQSPKASRSHPDHKFICRCRPLKDTSKTSSVVVSPHLTRASRARAYIEGDELEGEFLAQGLLRHSEGCLSSEQEQSYGNIATISAPCRSQTSLNEGGDRRLGFKSRSLLLQGGMETMVHRETPAHLSGEILKEIFLLRTNTFFCPLLLKDSDIVSSR